MTFCLFWKVLQPSCCQMRRICQMSSWFVKFSLNSYIKCLRGKLLQANAQHIVCWKKINSPSSESFLTKIIVNVKMAFLIALKRSIHCWIQALCFTGLNPTRPWFSEIHKLDPFTFPFGKHFTPFTFTFTFTFTLLSLLGSTSSLSRRKHLVHFCRKNTVASWRRPRNVYKCDIFKLENIKGIVHKMGCCIAPFFHSSRVLLLSPHQSVGTLPCCKTPPRPSWISPPPPEPSWQSSMCLTNSQSIVWSGSTIHLLKMVWEPD